MGYLTTITIHNDALDQIKKNPEGFTQKVYEGCIGALTRNGRAESFGIGNYANPVTVQPPRHADDHTVYVHCGNTVVDMNSYGKEAERINEKFPKFFDQMVDIMERNLKNLKKMQKQRI